MTAQISERLSYEGQQLAMCTNPLSLYFAMGGDGRGDHDRGWWDAGALVLHGADRG